MTITLFGYELSIHKSEPPFVPIASLPTAPLRTSGKVVDIASKRLDVAHGLR